LSASPVLRCSLSPIAPAPALRSLTVAANSDGMLPTLVGCITRADELLRAGAYLHWYERFGVERTHIEAAAEAVLNTVDAYMEARAAAAPPPAAAGGRRGGAAAAARR